MNNIFKILCLSFVIALSVINCVFAGVTGKIVGYIKDENTGEPLQGVNVIIEGIMLGAASDNTGYYFVINVPPGSYTLKAQMMGYKTGVTRKVLVATDLTTTVNFDLVPTVLMGEEVVVIAERPLVQIDMTAKISVVTSEEIENMPVENLVEILGTLPGFTDASHLRGGRGNEIAYMIDGMYISDPLSNTYDELLIDKDIIEELVVMSGTFNAEYGNVMSGVVNVITKDPTPELHWKLDYLSPMLNESPYRSYRVENGQKINNGTGVPDTPPRELEYKPQKISDLFTSWDRRNILGQFRGNLSGVVPLIPELTFLLSGRYLNENSYLPFGYSLGWEGLGKLIYKLTPDMKLKLLVRRTQKNYQNYSHGWKYRPDHYCHSDRFTELGNLVFIHTISPSTFYTIRVSHYKQTFEQKVPGKELDIGSILAVEDRDTTVNAITDYKQPVSWVGEFNYLGDYGTCLWEKTGTLGGKVDFNSQINKHHFIKAGVELFKHTIDRLWFEEPWVDGSHEYQDYCRHPLELAAYFQDKVEYDFLIMNLGLRLDYFDPKASVFPNIYDPGYVDESGEFQYYPEKAVHPKYQISPRIGLAHPVTEKLVFHFAYGHFFQRPDYQDMYYLHEIMRLFNIAGNPKMNAQRTQAFEVGVKQQIGDLFAAELSMFYKDIFDLSGSTFLLYYPHPFAIYDNSDYANSKGLEFSIQKRYSHYFSGSLNYMWSIALGNENTSKEGASKYWGSSDNRLRPRRPFPLDWDRRHVIGLNIDFRIPAGSGPQIFGVKPLANLSANFIVQVKSGLPYTPLEFYYPELKRNSIRNSERMPWTERVDMRISKKFGLMGLSTSITLKVTNLFDTKNVVSVNAYTGKPWDAGLTSPYSEDYQRVPTAYEAPRQVYLQIGISW